MGGSGHWRGSLLGSRGHTALLDLKPSGFSGSRVSPPSTAGAIMSPKGRLPTYLRTSFYDLERVGNVSLLGNTTQLLAKCGNPWGVVAVVVGVCVCVCVCALFPPFFPNSPILPGPHSVILWEMLQWPQDTLLLCTRYSLK